MWKRQSTGNKVRGRGGGSKGRLGERGAVQKRQEGPEPPTPTVGATKDWLGAPVAVTALPPGSTHSYWSKEIRESSETQVTYSLELNLWGDLGNIMFCIQDWHFSPVLLCLQNTQSLKDAHHLSGVYSFTPKVSRPYPVPLAVLPSLVHLRGPPTLGPVSLTDHPPHPRLLFSALLSPAGPPRLRHQPK